MRRTNVIALGTAACAAALHFRRRVHAEIRLLERAARRASGPARSALLHRISELKGAIRTLAIDLDGTEAYRLPPPLETAGSTWMPGESLKVSLHPREVIERFRAGQLPDLDQVNPETLRGLDAENASGGARPNADLAFQVSSERIISALRQCLVELLRNRQALTSTQDFGIRVFLMAGTFGGTGSGSYDRVKMWLLRLGDELGVHLDVYPIFLLPGAHAPKDPGTSYSNTFAFIKEQIADSTGSYTRYVPGSTHPQRSGFRAPFLLSDVNNAPGGPRVLSDAAFTALVGDLIYELTATPLGSHLDAQVGDYGVAGTTPTVTGEPRHARSIGISSIFLDVERQELWSRSTVALRFVATASKAAPEGILRADVRAFLEGNALVFSDGRNDISGFLLEQCASREHLSVTRLRALFSHATQELTDTAVLTEGRGCLDLALQQCGDFEPALQRHTDEMIESAKGLVTAEVRRLLTDHRRGPASASLWLAIAGGVIDAMLAAAGNELGKSQGELNELDGRIRQTEAEYMEQSAGRGGLYRFLHRGSLSRSAIAYRADLEAWAILRVQTQAVAAAMRVLNQLRQTIHHEIQATTQPVLATLAAVADRLREDQRRAAAHSQEFGCANGLALLASESDLVELHTRCFPDADEAQAVNEFYSRLGDLESAASVLMDGESLLVFFQETAPKTLIGARLDELNVIDELKRRYPDPAQLGSILRERDFEAYERLPLVATTDQTSGVTLVRLAGMDAARLESVRKALDANQTGRPVRYLPVDTGDRQRITFLQVRAVFPFSDWRGYSIARGYYESASGSAVAEKQHILPGNRFLPVPGRSITEAGLAALLVRAWVLGRLSWSENPGWSVLPASDGDTAVHVAKGGGIEPQLSYRLAVDLISSTSYLMRSTGVAMFRQRLHELRQAIDGGTLKPGLEHLRKSGLLEEAVRQLHVEAEWWERNTCVPAGQRYSAGVAG